jgi:ribosome maturation factor RimP
VAQSTPDGVTALLGPVTAGAGLVLEGVTITPAGRRRVVRVVVDLPDDETGSVDLDQVAEVSRAVSDALDSSDVLGGRAYVLEVSSPGVDRPLTARRHWSRARGRLVRTTADGAELAGRVRAVDDDGVVLDTDDGERTLAWAALGRGSVQVEFRRDTPAGPDDTLEEG